MSTENHKKHETLSKSHHPIIATRMSTSNSSDALPLRSVPKLVKVVQVFVFVSVFCFCFFLNCRSYAPQVGTGKFSHSIESQRRGAREGSDHSVGPCPEVLFKFGGPLKSRAPSATMEGSVVGEQDG